MTTIDWSAEKIKVDRTAMKLEVLPSLLGFLILSGDE